MIPQTIMNPMIYPGLYPVVQEAFKEKRCVTLRAGRADEQTIIIAVCKFYTISNRDLISRNNSRNMVVPRQIAIKLLRDKTHLSIAKIGHIIGRHHATIMYSLNTIQGLIEHDKKVRNEYNELLKLIA